MVQNVKNGEKLCRRLFVTPLDTGNMIISENTPGASSVSNESLPPNLGSDRVDGRRRSPRLLSIVPRSESEKEGGVDSRKDGVFGRESPPTHEILSQNAYSQPSSSLASSLNTGGARRSLASVINDDNYDMDLSSNNFACCFSDSDEEGGFDVFSPLIEDDDWYLDDEKDIVDEEYVEIYESIESTNESNSSNDDANEFNATNNNRTNETDG